MYYFIILCCSFTKYTEVMIIELVSTSIPVVVPRVHTRVRQTTLAAPFVHERYTVIHIVINTVNLQLKIHQINAEFFVAFANGSIDGTQII